MAETVGELLAEGRRALARAAGGRTDGPSPREAHLLLAHVLGRTEARLLAYPEIRVTAGDAARYRALLGQRAAGAPAAYLLGEKEFWGRRFGVDQRVLIPRPETEHLIELALRADLPAAPRILDVGTGSGCLAVTLACELPAARAVATDLSPPALAVAATNARRHGVAGRVALLATDLAAGLDLTAFDLVVSNPPYVPPEDASSLPPEVGAHEPPGALFAAQGGTATLARLLAELAGLRSGTPLLAEIGRGQHQRVRRLVEASPFRLEGIESDHAGIPRLVVLRRR